MKKKKMIIFSFCLFFILLLYFSFPVLRTVLIFPGHQTQNQRWVLEKTAAFRDSLIPLTTSSGQKTFFRWGAALPKNKTVYSSYLSQDRNLITQDSMGPKKDSSPWTLLFFYGNACCLADIDSTFTFSRNQHWNIGIPEYLGYGIASGQPSEQGCYETALAAYDYLTEVQKIPPEKIILWGHSLGTGVACELATRRRVGGVILCSGFTTFKEIAHEHFPILPLWLLESSKWLKIPQFSNKEKLPTISCPLLFIHGQKDTVVPLRMSQENVQAAKKTNKAVDFKILSDAGHEIFQPSENFLEVFQTISIFLKKIEEN